jgi:hypothetical protein
LPGGNSQGRIAKESAHSRRQFRAVPTACSRIVEGEPVSRGARCERRAHREAPMSTTLEHEADAIVART